MGLEKKFQKKQVIMIANRTIMDKNYKRLGHQSRPRTRCLTSVHEAILEDVVFPAEIVGKRTRVNTDGSKVMKIALRTAAQKGASKKRSEVDEKLSVFSSVYRELTHKDVEFTEQE